MKNQRVIQITKDGSHTVAIPSKNITYRSMHGALQESMHIYIKAGLNYWIKQNSTTGKPVSVFEMGLGTGLNALLTCKEATLLQHTIFYYAIDLFPLTKEEAANLNYDQFIAGNNVYLQAIHHAAWNEIIKLNDYFSFIKTITGLQQLQTTHKFNIIYFDAFDPNAQPALWTEAIFKKMFDMLYNNGILVTYCSKRSVQSAMKAAGFSIEKLEGPPGKREIVRATKFIH